MPSIKEIQARLKDFDAIAREGREAHELQTSWTRLFRTPLTDLSAKSFVQYYKDMRSPSGRNNRHKSHKNKKDRRNSRQHGGSATLLTPAPLQYQTVPGANVQVYGRFPIEAATDAASIRNMDVYFNSGISRGCGIDNSSLQVPASMGSNKVGGRRSRRNHRNRRTRKQRGGNLLESLMVHPYLSSAPPSSVQTFANAYAGAPPYAPSSPTQHTWAYMGRGTSGLIDPGLITPIGSDFSKLASPPAWQS